MSVSDTSAIANPGGTAPPPLPFYPHHVQYLEKRCVDPGWAAHAGLRAVTAEEGAKLIGFERALSSPGLAIPYPNVPGYVRIRLDAGDTRFLAPRDREVPVYLPPDCLREGDEPIYVVEGPIKALALRDHSFNAVGLGGTGTTLTTKDDVRRLNSSWGTVAITGRHVVIVFDSNRATNPNVARDEARLAQALELAGAKVRVAALPPREGGGDWGPDDFLAEREYAALKAVIDAAVPAAPIERCEFIATHFNKEEERWGAAVALLDDLPFLASVRERGVSVELQVQQQLGKYKVKMSDFRRAMKRLDQKGKEKTAPDPASATTCAPYAVHGGQLCCVKRVGDAVVHEPICNFNAGILHEEVLDDGLEQQRRFTVAGNLVTGEALCAVHIRPSELSSESWPLEKWGAKALVCALPRAAAHLRAAIQAHSAPPAFPLAPARCSRHRRPLPAHRC